MKHTTTTGPAEPSQDELLAMAYSDGELPPAERAAFEARMSGDPALARHVAEYRALELLAREMAPAEPADHEWRRLELDPLYRSGNSLGYFLLGAGGLGLGLWITIDLVRSELDFAPKVCCLSLMAGAAILLLTTLWSRVRTLPYDPYRKVNR